MHFFSTKTFKAPDHPPHIPHRHTFLAFAISISRAFLASLVSGWYFLHSFRTLAASQRMPKKSPNQGVLAFWSEMRKWKKKMRKDAKCESLFFFMMYCSRSRCPLDF